MQYEVEQKFRFDGAESGIEDLLAGHSAMLGEPMGQSDEYFAHPCRDFAQTDEALRIRTESGRSFVTYKGPKIDTTTKTRHEIELPLDADDTDGKKLRELLQAIGFSPVATVHKIRRAFTIHSVGHNVKGAFDLVDKLGVFVELELLAEEAALEEAKRVIGDLAKKLDLGPSVRRSYLEMLLEKNA